MTARDFCFWLQGMFELADADQNKKQLAESLSAQQVQTIKNHLSMVFKHEIDPSMGSPAHQQVLNDIHSPKPPGGMSGGTSGPSGSQDYLIRC